MAEVKRKSKAIMKGMKVPVTIEDSINDVLVVCLNVGTKSFRGVLMDIQKRNEPHGIPSEDTPPSPEDENTVVPKHANKIITRKRSSGNISRSPKKEHNENDQRSSFSCLPLRHSYNQDLSHLDEQYAVFARKPNNFRFGSKVRNIRLRPRQVFCAKCKAACIEDKAKAAKQNNADKMSTRSSTGNANDKANNPTTMTTRFSLRRQKANEEEKGATDKTANGKSKKKVDSANSKETIKQATTISTQTDNHDCNYVSLTNEIMGLSAGITSNLRVNLSSELPKVSPVIKISIGDNKIMEIPSRLHHNFSSSLGNSAIKNIYDETKENIENVDGYTDDLKSKMYVFDEPEESDAESYSSYKKKRKLMKKAAKDKDREKDKDKHKAGEGSDESGKRKHKRKRKHKHWSNEDKKSKYMNYNVKEFSLASDEKEQCDPSKVKIEKEETDVVETADRPRLLLTWRPNESETVEPKDIPSIDKPPVDKPVVDKPNGIDIVEKTLDSVTTEDIRITEDLLKQELDDQSTFNVLSPDRSELAKQITDIVDNDKHFIDIKNSPLVTNSPSTTVNEVKLESKENLNPKVDVKSSPDLDEIKHSPLDSPLRSLEQFNRLSADVGRVISRDNKSSNILPEGSPVAIMSPLTFSTPPHDDASDSKIDIIWNSHNESVRQASVIRSLEQKVATTSSIATSVLWGTSPSFVSTEPKNTTPDIFKITDVSSSLKDTSDIWTMNLGVSPNNSSVLKSSDISQKSTPDRDFLLSLKSPNDSSDTGLSFTSKQHSTPARSMNDLWKATSTPSIVSPLSTSTYNDPPVFKPSVDVPVTTFQQPKEPFDFTTHDKSSTATAVHSSSAPIFSTQSWLKTDDFTNSRQNTTVTSSELLQKVLEHPIWTPHISPTIKPPSVSTSLLAKETTVIDTTISKPKVSDLRPMLSLGFDTRLSQPLSLETRSSQPMPLDARSAQPIPLDTRPSQPIPLDTRSSQPIPLDTRSSQPMPLDTRSSQPYSLDIPHTRSLSIDTRSSQSYNRPSQSSSLNNRLQPSHLDVRPPRSTPLDIRNNPPLPQPPRVSQHLSDPRPNLTTNARLLQHLSQHIMSPLDSKKQNLSAKISSLTHPLPNLNPHISSVTLDTLFTPTVIKSAPSAVPRSTMSLTTRTSTTSDSHPMMSIDRHLAHEDSPQIMNYIKSRPMFNIFTPRNTSYNKPPLPRTSWSRNEHEYQPERPKPNSSQMWQSERGISHSNSYNLPRSETWNQNSHTGLSNSKLREQLSPNFVPDIWKQQGKPTVEQRSPVEKSSSYKPQVVMNPEYSDISDSDDGNDTSSNKVSPPPPRRPSQVTESNVESAPPHLSFLPHQSIIAQEPTVIKHPKNKLLPSPGLVPSNLTNSSYNSHSFIPTATPDLIFPSSSHTSDKPLTHLNINNHFNPSSADFLDKPSTSLMPVVRNHNVSKCVTTHGCKISQNDVVWGKVQGSTWWPARVLSITIAQNDTGTILSQVAQLMWFGSSTLSCNNCDDLSPFLDEFHLRYNKKKKGVYRMAVKEAALASQNDIKMYHNINLEELENS